jgi:ATP-binding cassette subfamily B protein
MKQIAEDGTELSGGETQKLLLARALYKKASVIILDEPTAALDPIAENEIYQKYNELIQGKTAIFISHRLSSTRFCDRIIMLSDKRIAETGTHEELMARGGKYASVFRIQSQYYQDKTKNGGATHA